MSEAAATILAGVTAPAAAATAPGAEPAATAPAATSTPITFGPDEKWKESLPPELQSDPTIKNIKNISDGFKMLVHAQKQIGADKIVVPGKHATEEEMNKVFDKLGRPESPEKYDLKIPEGAKADEANMKAFKEIMHKTGVLPSQAQKILEYDHQRVQKAMADYNKNMEAQKEEVISGLKKELGQAFDSKLGDAITTLKNIAGDEMTDRIMKNPALANNPDFLRLAIKLSELTKEDDVNPQKSSGGGALTPKEAQKQIGLVMADHKHPYHDATHPNHKMAVEDVNKLFAMKANVSK